METPEFFALIGGDARAGASFDVSSYDPFTQGVGADTEITRLGGGWLTYKRAISGGDFEDPNCSNPRRHAQCMCFLCLTMAALLTERDNVWSDKGYPEPW